MLLIILCGVLGFGIGFLFINILIEAKTLIDIDRKDV